MQTSRSSIPMQTEQQSRNLDLLRACAVMCVFIGHGMLTLHGVNYLVGGFARFGVMAFFVHTAFVLMQSLERLERDGGNVTLRFYIRRLFRIYPLVIATVIAVAAFHIPAAAWKGVVPATGRTVLSNVLLIQNLVRKPDMLVPLWSLPFEVQMYAVLPLVYFLVKRRGVNPLLLAFGCVLASLPIFPAYFTGIIAYFPCFLAGVAAYRMSRMQKPQLSIVVFLVVLVGLCAAYTVARTYLRTYKPTWIFVESVTDWLASLTIALLLPRIREIPEGWVSRTAHQVAQYSYGVYVSHVIVMWFVYVKMAGTPIALRIAVFVAASVGVPVLAFHLLEQPALNLGKQVAAKFRRPARVSAQAA